MIERVLVVVIYVSDAEVSARFFTNTLGFERRREKTYVDGRRWIEVGPPDEPTSLALVTSGQEFSPNPVKDAGVIFSTKDLDHTYESLRSSGVEFAWEPTLRADGGRDAALLDPDGNEYLIVESPG